MMETGTAAAGWWDACQSSSSSCNLRHQAAACVDEGQQPVQQWKLAWNAGLAGWDVGAWVNVWTAAMAQGLLLWWYWCTRVVILKIHQGDCLEDASGWLSYYLMDALSAYWKKLLASL